MKIDKVNLLYNKHNFNIYSKKMILMMGQKIYENLNR